MVLDRESLDKWRKQEGRTWVWVAHQVGVEPQTLYQQLGGRCGVSLKLALSLETLTGIPLRSFVREAAAS